MPELCENLYRHLHHVDNFEDDEVDEVSPNFTMQILMNHKPLIWSRRLRLEEYVRELRFNMDYVHLIEVSMRKAIEEGLSLEKHADSPVKCYPTYVYQLPNGSEVGKYLSLDLGGTNFRVMVMELRLGRKFNIDSEIYAIPKSIMEGKGEQLFDHIANCLYDFVVERNIANEELPLGFTFSFPCVQEGLSAARLVKWTKGFCCEGVVGKDIVRLLREAIAKKGNMKINICAVLNDSTGCLMSCAWLNDQTRIGVIVGTGTNACYLEKVENIHTINQEEFADQEYMLINTEWGAFGDNGELDFIKTKWDKVIDSQSINPGKQTYEKMISGMYMGELIRLILLDLIKEELIFLNTPYEKLRESGSFLTRYVSEIETDEPGIFERTKNVVIELGFDLKNVSQLDLSSLRYVCEIVCRRAGFIVTAGITALLKKMNYGDATIAVDGSIFRFHPRFMNVMSKRIQKIMGKEHKFDFMLSEDGSGRGAALVAAALKREGN